MGLAHEPFPQLDSIGNSQSISKHFGRLYYVFLSMVEEQLSGLDTPAQKMVRNFEKVFAGFYIDACNAHEANKEIAVGEWQAYYSRTDLSPIQYKLLGTNAHLNGALWQAFTLSFSQAEMEALKKEFVFFKRSLNRTYVLVYKEAVRDSKTANTIRNRSFGLSRLAGDFYLYKWRKRQMKLARLYWNDSPKFEALLKKVDLKKQKIDRLIITMI